MEVIYSLSPWEKKATSENNNNYDRTGDLVPNQLRQSVYK